MQLIKSLPRWAFTASCIAIPLAIFTTIRAGSYDIIDELDLFSLALYDLLPATFPILISVFCLLRYSDELSNGFTRSVRTRTSLGNYLLSSSLKVALSAMAIFTIVVFIVWLYAFVLSPATFATLHPGEIPESVSSRYRFTELMAISPLLYGAFISLWTGLNAAAYAALGFAALVWIPNRFVALAIPFIVYWAATIVPALFGLESYAAAHSVFSFSIIQVPWWQAIPHLIAIACFASIGLFAAKFVDYQTPGLD